MRLFYLADGASIHTRKWVNSLLKKGHRIHLYSLNDFNPISYQDSDNNFTYTVHNLSRNNTVLGGINKVFYLSAAKDMKIQISKYKPDIIHAHFATSYGLLARKANFHPTIVSVWGYDVFHFPKRSVIHKYILKHNLSFADKILSTSHVMAKETALYTDKEIEVTPFGIDTDTFIPKDVPVQQAFPSLSGCDFIIGTAKPLEDKYAIDDLIKAFSLLTKKYPDKIIKLAIAGKGSSESKLRLLARRLGVEEKTVFLGQIEHMKIPDFYNAIDVFSALSLEESFGVAVIEASACGKPVVVSDIGGLPEVVEYGITGSIVPPRDPEAAAKAFEELLLDASLRKKMGIAGRERAMALYDWNNCVEQMHNIYLTL